MRLQRARKGEAAEVAARRALAELAGVNRNDLTDDDQSAYNDAAMRANATRWAAMPASVPASARSPSLVTAAGQPGETCIALVDAKHDAANPLAKRCTYGVVWTGSATLNREGTALALAVQPMDAWREMWVFRKDGNGWTVSVLPPAATNPEVGYIEFAAGCPAARRCSWRAKRGVKGNTGGTSKSCAWTRLRSSASRATRRSSVRSSGGRTRRGSGRR